MTSDELRIVRERIELAAWFGALCGVLVGGALVGALWVLLG